MTNYRIFVDMDGVLADFDRYFIEKFQVKFSSKFHNTGIWDTAIFKDLHPIEDAFELVDFLSTLQNPKAVLTALPNTENVYAHHKQHKEEWIKKYFPELQTDFRIGPYAIDKQNHCCAGDILIDDNPRNIAQWHKSGGFGILHHSAATTISAIKEYLDLYK